MVESKGQKRIELAMILPDDDIRPFLPAAACV